MTVKQAGAVGSSSNEAPASLLSVAVGCGWQLAELASLLADPRLGVAGRRPLADNLGRTLGHRIATLGLARQDGGPISTAGLGSIGDDTTTASALRSVLALHAAVLEGLDRHSAVHLRVELRTAYELGRALAQCSLVSVHAEQSGQPSLYRRVFDPPRLAVVGEWLATIRPWLAPEAAETVLYSLHSWSAWVSSATDAELANAGPALRRQARIWRDLLLGRPGAATSSGDSTVRVSGGAATTSGQASEAATSLTRGPAVEAGAGLAEPKSPPPARSPEAVTVLAPPVAETTPETGKAPVEPAKPDDFPGARSRWASRILSWVLVLVLAAVITVALRAFVVQPFSIPSGSMSPTLQVGDRILVDKLPGVSNSIHTGDIIVFRRVAADTSEPPTPDLVKRVIGLPGQFISSRGNTVLIDGRPLAQPWLPALAGECRELQLGIRPERIPANHFFVLGDCRGISYDSRYWGTVPRSHIIGKVFLVIWRHNHPWFHGF